MLSLTLHELTVITFGTAACMVATVLIAAWGAWRQEQDIRDLRAWLTELDEDLDVLWEWARAWGAGGDQDPDDDDPDEPDTVIAHPADSFARKQHLLARYAHAGQHRSSDRLAPAKETA